MNGISEWMGITEAITELNGLNYGVSLLTINLNPPKLWKIDKLWALFFHDEINGSTPQAKLLAFVMFGVNRNLISEPKSTLEIGFFSLAAIAIENHISIEVRVNW